MENKSDIILTVGIGTAVFVVLIMAIILFAVTYNRKIREKESAHKLEIKSKELELLKAVIHTQENERDQLARNLHDEVGPLISALKLRFAIFKRKLEKHELTSHDLMNETIQIDHIMDNVRSISHELSPHFVQRFGLYGSISMFADRITTPKITLFGENEVPVDLDRHISGNLYRIILELLNNTIRHDSVHKIAVTFSKSTDNLIITITHDGNGIDNNGFENYLNSSKGLGLASIKSRIIIINAILVLRKKGVEGAQIQLSVPLNTEQ